MNKSDTITALAASLTKAQAEMSGAKKNAKNPFFKSQYANLEEVIHCIKEPFADHGLSFVQFPISEDGRAGVETVIMHESGEWISNDFMLTCSKNDPQGMGSAITYARRYGLQAAVGVPSEDDDGNAATRPSSQKQAAKTAPAPDPMTTTQHTSIKTLIVKAELDAERTIKGIQKSSGGRTSSLDHLMAPEAAKLIGMLTKIIESKPVAA